MEASKSLDETVEIMPLVRQHGDERRRRRRHVRFPGSAVLLAFVVTFFCAACLAITLRSAFLLSDLQERMDRLESDVKSRTAGEDLHRPQPPSSSSLYPGEDDLDDDNDKNVENFADEIIVKVDHELGHRLKREANDKKKKQRQKTPAKAKVQSAIHLNLDVQRPTEGELQYHNGEHAYVYKAWKVADWAKGEKDYEFDASTGGVKIQRKGLYFIYSQILYHNSATRSSYMIMVDKEGFIKCMESVDAVMPDSQTSADSARYKTCYVGAARVLNKGQTVWIKDLYSRFVTTDSTANFFGLMKIADLEK